MGLAGAQIGASHVAPRRRSARQADGRNECLQLHRKRRTEILVEERLLLGYVGRLGILPGNQLRGEGQIGRRAEYHLSHRVHRYAAPVEHPEIARMDQGALGRWRGVPPFVAQRVELDVAHHLVDQRGTPQVLALQLRRLVGQCRRRLRPGDPVTLGRALRCRHLAHRQDRLTRATVEYIDVALLGRRHQRGHRPLLGLDVDQARLRRYVHVPEVMAHRLEDPTQLAAIQIEGDD